MPPNQRYIAGAITGAALVLATALPARADWKAMPVQDLTGLKLVYENAWQDFRDTGRTLYNAGEDSWGYWREEGGQYCSQWPPRNEWTCYGLERRGDEIRFIAKGGHVTVGRIE